MKTHNPYIGPRSFTRQEGDRFFGREREARELLSLVIAERLVLFYAQSGAGKTSLLNTRLIPGLEENGRAVLPVARVSGDLPEGAEEVGNIFAFNLTQHLNQGTAKTMAFAQLDLSNFLRHLVSEDGRTYRYDPAEEEAAENEDAPVCVLIIDQFEEILTAHQGRWQERAEFFRQLNQAMQDDPKLSVVLSLREDYAAALEPYAPLLADRMRARFYMERMGHQTALAAISEPAAKAGRPFARGAAELLADNLSLVRSGRDKKPRPGQYIEPVQLQVVCWQLWQNLAEGEAITAADVQGAGNIDHALADFYEQAVAEAVRQTKVSELELRQWFDRRLITEAGTRGTVFQGEETTGGMDNRAVRLLEDRFLLRAESRSGAVWYELVHDRFVEPIMQANRAWLAAQGPLLRDAQAWLDSGKVDRSLLYVGEKMEKTLAEVGDLSLLEPVVAEFLEGCKGRQAWLDEKAAANQRFRTWFKIANAVAILAIIASTLAVYMAYRARTAERTSLNAQKKTQATLTQLQNTGALNAGMALNAKAEAAESKGSKLYAHLYSLHALDRLAQNNKDSDAYLEAVLRAQANPVPVPAFIGHHEERVNGVAFSPDGHTVASASHDKTIGIWDAVTGKRLQTLAGHTDGVSSVAFSSDGRLLASGSADKTISIWNVQTGQRLRTLEGHTDWVRSVALLQDNSLIASCSKDKTIGIWDAQTGKRLHTLAGQSNVSSVTFSPDGRTIASTFYDGTISIWNLQTGERSQSLDGYTSALLGIAFSPDGSILASGSFGRIDLWDIKTSQRLRTMKRDTNWVITGLSFSPDGRTLASGSFGNIISIWDIETGQCLRVLQGTASGRSIAFSPDGQTLVSSGSWNKTVGLWEAAAGKLRYLKGHAGQVQGISFSTDGRTARSVSKDKTIGIWDVATGRHLQKIPLQGMTGMDSVLFSPDGSMFAARSYGSKSIRLGEVSTGNWLRNLVGHTDQVDNFSFSPDSRIITSASSDKTVKIWDVQTGKCLRTLPIEDDIESSISFSPNGRLFAAGLKSNNIVIWDSATGKRLQTFKGFSGISTFSSDSRLLAVSDSGNHTIGILNIATGQRLQTLKGHMAFWVSSSTFSPDNRLIASNFMDKTIAIWDVKTGKRVRTLKENNINSEGIIAFSPGSRYLAFSTDDNGIGLWDLEDNPNEFSGIFLDKNGEYKIDLKTLPYKLDGLELKPIEEKQTGPDQPARWSKYHPFHWLPQAEAGDSNAMLQIGIIYDRNNDLARALRWYQKAVKAGSAQAKEQQGRLLHWLEDKDNWQTVPSPFRDSFCKAKMELELPEKVRELCR